MRLPDFSFAVLFPAPSVAPLPFLSSLLYFFFTFNKFPETCSTKKFQISDIFTWFVCILGLEK
jgi:hypothetical protein